MKMSTQSVLAVATVFSMIPGGLLNDTRCTQGLDGQQLAQGSAHLHRRLKRGWLWKQLFVPEEDPTPRVIGQVLLQDWVPSMSFTQHFTLKMHVFLLAFEISTLSPKSNLSV